MAKLSPEDTFLGEAFIAEKKAYTVKYSYCLEWSFGTSCTLIYMVSAPLLLKSPQEIHEGAREMECFTGSQENCLVSATNYLCETY